MVSDVARRVGVSAAVLVACAFAASLLWHIPYVFTVITLLGLSFVGFVVTLDDDLPGGWSPHPGGLVGVLRQLVVYLLVLAAAVALAVFFPGVRALGGA